MTKVAKVIIVCALFSVIPIYALLIMASKADDFAEDFFGS